MDEHFLSSHDDPRLEHYAVRPATPGDAAGIARVYVATWKRAYRGIIPDAHLDRLAYRHQYQTRRSMLEAPSDGRRTFVATEPVGWIIGFVDIGASHGDLEFAGELVSLVVMEQYRDLAIDAWLLETAIRAQLAAGRRSMRVWALADDPSRRVYEAYGAEQIATRPVQIGGATLTEVAYGWHDLGAVVGK
ncbi:MAG: N-acetyltransferase [Dehalococcoidia bacterium]|jgi:ribosomal protein S18 acetylase RimI-like enzyme|nr:MAG: N-acetyltransferase [Dehalococcoidia bacterium]